MRQINKIAVLSGGGRTGNYVIAQLLNQGYSIKLLLRSPSTFQVSNPSISILQGDALDDMVTRSLVEDCQAVVSTLGQRKDEPLVAAQATINVLKAMTECGIQRYILVAGLNVDTPFDKKSPATRTASEWMKTNFPAIHEDRQKAYSVLSSSNVNWTLIRVPFIDFAAMAGKTIVSLEDCPGNKISASDIATFVVRQLRDDTYFKKSPFISNV